jgi:hypothetical protein
VPAPHNEKQMITIASFNIRFTEESRLVASVRWNAALNAGDK